MCVCVCRGCLHLIVRQPSQESLALLSYLLTVLNQAGRFWRNFYFTALLSLCDLALVYITVFISWPLSSTPNSYPSHSELLASPEHAIFSHDAASVMLFFL